MTSEFTNKPIRKDLIHPDLSYKLVGIFFEAHNKLGRFRSEKEYGDFLEGLFTKYELSYEREKPLKSVGVALRNKVDFLIDNKILVDLKTKKFVSKEDYIQMRRYLDASGLPLGLIVNFRNTYLKAKRVINPNSDSSYA